MRTSHDVFSMTTDKAKYRLCYHGGVLPPCGIFGCLHEISWKISYFNTVF